MVKILAFKNKQTGEYWAITLLTNENGELIMGKSRTSFMKSMEDMFRELNEDGVAISIFGPKNFNYGGKAWHVGLKKEAPGVTLEVKDTTHDDLMVALRIAYDKWYDHLYVGLQRELGTPQLEHQAEETPPAKTPLDALNERLDKPLPSKVPDAAKPSESLKALHEQAGVGAKDLDLDDEIPF